ncbi:hypothetical protein GRJ2_000578500 [Grus japonensis]|uniref:Uncharacterized protein n=1 Tax=Grus japonensis TaxID=30415 RepID=A0ABC9WAC3_GRUJA
MSGPRRSRVATVGTGYAFEAPQAMTATVSVSGMSRNLVWFLSDVDRLHAHQRAAEEGTSFSVATCKWQRGRGRVAEVPQGASEGQSHMPMSGPRRSHVATFGTGCLFELQGARFGSLRCRVVIVTLLPLADCLCNSLKGFVGATGNLGGAKPRDDEQSKKVPRGMTAEGSVSGPSRCRERGSAPKSSTGGEQSAVRRCKAGYGPRRTQTREVTRAWWGARTAAQNDGGQVPQGASEGRSRVPTSVLRRGCAAAFWTGCPFEVPRGMTAAGSVSGPSR